MKKLFIIFFIFPILFIGCQTVPECQKHSTSELTIINDVGLIIEVAVQMREPDGDQNYGFRIIKPNSSTTYKKVDEGHITLWVRLNGSNEWVYKDTYNVKCLDHDFVWKWDTKDFILEE
jgi:hypothetical protein